jgi:hypothetical protein
MSDRKLNSGRVPVHGLLLLLLLLLVLLLLVRRMLAWHHRSHMASFVSVAAISVTIRTIAVVSKGGWLAPLAHRTLQLWGTRPIAAAVLRSTSSASGHSTASASVQLAAWLAAKRACCAACCGNQHAHSFTIVIQMLHNGIPHVLTGTHVRVERQEVCCSLLVTRCKGSKHHVDKALHYRLQRSMRNKCGSFARAAGARQSIISCSCSRLLRSRWIVAVSHPIWWCLLLVIYLACLGNILLLLLLWQELLVRCSKVGSCPWCDVFDSLSAELGARPGQLATRQLLCQQRMHSRGANRTLHHTHTRG